jgi:hypothetical protein
MTRFSGLKLCERVDVVNKAQTEVGTTDQEVRRKLECVVPDAEGTDLQMEPGAVASKPPVVQILIGRNCTNGSVLWR